jgi:hypothetical protein
MKKECYHYSKFFMARVLREAGVDDDDALTLARILDQFDFHLKKQVGKAIMFFSKGYKGREEKIKAEVKD